ncbi:TATA box-binding-like protein 1 [Elysia marginata]|uniref:TATA box-binding-like protein 1 n=1 Tax=Elysia marginata TaxID=1093978 RepID=A0AAV4JV94_9GAST|nr:TATA box-binding-like protein 1 [Elysia marginata]
MSILSNHAIVMNGTCHGQQFTTLIPATGTVNPSGDNSTNGLQKAISPSNQETDIEAQRNGNCGLVQPNGDNHGGDGMENGAGIAEEDAPCIDIIINNVVCSFSTKCYLNLKKIATEGAHVEYRRENGCYGCEVWTISKQIQELHPGVTYKIKEPKATLKIFSTGSITVTAPSVENIQHAIEHIYPLVVPHKMDTPHVKNKLMVAERKALKKQGVYMHLPFEDDDDEEEEEEEDEELEWNGVVHPVNDLKDEEDDDDFSDDFDSDVSHD